MIRALVIALTLAVPLAAQAEQKFTRVTMETKVPRKSGKGKASEWVDVYVCKTASECAAAGITDRDSAEAVGKKKCEEKACGANADADMKGKFACQIYRAEADLNIVKHRGKCP